MTPLDASSAMAAPLTLPTAPAGPPPGPPGLADVVDIATARDGWGRARGRRASRPARAWSPAPQPRAGADAAVVAAAGGCLFVAAGAAGCVRVVSPTDPDAPSVVLGSHGAPVRALVARDGLLASAGTDGRVHRWRPGAPDAGPAAVGRHRTGVTSMTVTADGALVTAGHDGQVLAWGAGVAARVGTHRGGVEAMAATASGVLVTAGRDGRLLCWDPGGAGVPVELRQRRPELTPALGVVGGTLLVTATGQLGVVRVWHDLADGGRPEELGIHRGWVLALVALGGDRVAAAGGDVLTLWDLRTGAQSRLPLDPGVHVTGAVALDGGDLALCGPDGRVQVVGASRLVA